jgi:hypothetical protein
LIKLWELKEANKRRKNKMTKPIIITVPCGSNTVVAGDVLEQDGAGAVHKLDASGDAIGIAYANKDTENNVGMIIQGLKPMPAAAASYNVGAKLGINSSGVIAYSSGTVAGIAAETKTVSTTYSSTDRLKVYLNITN